MNEFEIIPTLSFERYEDEGAFEQERGRIGGGARMRAPSRRALTTRALRRPSMKLRPRPRPRTIGKPSWPQRPRRVRLPPSWPPYGAGYALPLVVERDDGGSTTAPSGTASFDDERRRCVEACLNRTAGVPPAGVSDGEPAPGPDVAPPDTGTPDSAAANGNATDGDAAAPTSDGEFAEFDYQSEYEDEPENGAAPDCKIIDLTAQSDRSVPKGVRDPKSVYALVLHQMACCFRRRNPLRSYLRIKSHFAILPEGQILQLHPVSALLWASHGFNSKSVAVEFAGNFPDVKGRWWKGETYGRDRPTAAQLQAGRCLVHHLVRTMGLRVVLAHRQSSNTRENDPGPEVWYHVGQWAVDSLGLSDGGPGFKIGTGKPILDAWRTWGRSSASPELERELEGEFEVTPGLLTLPTAIADPRAAGPGIYTLFKDQQRVFVGRARNLRRRLRQHLLCLTHLEEAIERFHVRLTPQPGASLALLAASSRPSAIGWAPQPNAGR